MPAPFRATYRLQLGPGLGFREARELVPYLRDLGISHLYLSPILQAREGSTHGYDVVDPTRISEALGGEQAFRELAAAGLGVVLDVVPNHMAATDENPYWRDPELREKFFDVDTRTGFHRRFFDIGELGGVRMEDAGVFETTHGLVLGLVREGLVHGLRIDHPDGLADPAGYLERLRRAGVEHVWVEKILEPGEELRDWPVEGTVGYEFLNDAAALFVDPEGEAPLTALYEELTGERRSFAELAYEAKLQVAVEIFEPELRELHQELDLPNLTLALASFHVYRTYVEPRSGHVHPADREAIHAAALSDRLERILLLDERGHEAFVTRFQQTTGPVMAKGVEDTAFYRYNRLVSLNEVGGDPSRFGLTVDEFHAGNIKRAQRFPRHLLTTQTHDAKRSADVRARIGALSWIPDEWRSRVLRWRDLNGGLTGGGAPDANEEYLIYQTLVGAWPIEAERLAAYVRKGMREAKVNTTWVDPNVAHEGAVEGFCRRLLEHRPFLDEFEPFAAEIARRGEHAALGQLLLKLASPGVPDVYGGDELPFLALVDPDNRRPVDWELHRTLLDEVLSGAAPRPETRKLALIARALDLRRRRPEAFDGAYMPLDAGPRACVFLRGRAVLAVVPVVVGGGGADVEIPAAVAGRWRDVVTGEEHELEGVVPVASLVFAFPVALLERVEATGGRHTAPVADERWTPEAWEDRPPAAPERLPRVDDLPLSDQGYDREAVRQAFEAFYRHAAQLDATLRVLESMEVFARQAGDLRADIRALRASSWGPLPAARPAWRPAAEERVYARRGGDLGNALPRLALEAAFIVVVAIGAAAADLSSPLIVALVVASWAIVGISEFVASMRRAPLRPAVLPPAPARREASAPARSAPAAAAEATMIEAPPPLPEEPVAEKPLVEEPVVEAEPEPEPVAVLPEVEAPPAPEPEPGPVAAEALPDEPRRRWFGRRRREAEEVARLVQPASGHVRVVPAPEEMHPEQPQLLAEPEPEPQPAAEAEPEPAPEVAVEPEPVAEPDAEPEPEAAAEAAPEPEAPPVPPWEPEPVEALQHSVTSPFETEVEPEPVAVEAEAEPESAPEAEPEPEPVEALQHSVTWEPEPEPGPVAEEQAPEPEAPLERGAAESEPPPVEDAAHPGRRRWFWRSREHAAETLEPERPGYVERIEVEQAIAPEQVSIAWDAEPGPDPWEQGPEPTGLELEAAEEPEPEPESEPEPEPEPAAEAELERQPQPARLRRGRR